MENKALLYAVLAISLGYLLVSSVPSQLAPPLSEEPLGDPKLLRAPESEQAEAPADSATAPAIELDEKFSGDSAEAQRDTVVAGGGSGNLVVSVFGTWSINLIVALGVYFIARRRFT